MRTLLLVSILALAVSVSAFASNSAYISIAAPLQNTDGSQITGALRYDIYQNGVLKELGWTAPTWFADPATLLAGTTQCWTAKAVEAGMTSAWSNQVCKTFRKVCPKHQCR
jgi:hypothetical protein